MPGRSQTRSQKRGITSRNNEESQNLPPSKRYKVDPPPAPEVGAKTSSRKKKPTERRNYQETKATEDQLRKLQLEVTRLKKKNGRQDIIIDTQRRERDRYYDAYYEANGHSPPESEHNIDDDNGKSKMGTDSDLASDEERLFPQSIRPLNTITNSPSHRTVRKASDWPVVASSQKGQIVRPSDESPVRETVQLPSPSPTQPVRKFYRPQQPQSPSAHQAQSPSQRDHVNSSVNNDDDSDTPSVTDDHQQLELSRGSMGTKLRDYIGLSKQVVRKSLNNFEAGVIGYHMFPQPETAYLFVQDIWDSQNEFLTERGEKPFRLTNEVVRLMFRRSTRIRGACHGRIEPLIGPTFKFDTRYNSARVKQKNLQRYILLSTDFGWYYKDPENRIGYMKNSIIFDAICAVLYHNKRAHGVCGNPWLNPVQKPTIAFAFTIVEYCLEKWSTGVFVETEMDENALQPVYQKHLARVEEWLALDTKKTTKIREAWTARGLALVGVTSYDSAEEDVSMSREDRDNALRELQESDGCESDESNDSGYEHPQRTENRDGGQKGKGKAVETREACDDGLEMRETGGESESEPDIGQS